MTVTRGVQADSCDAGLGVSHAAARTVQLHLSLGSIPQIAMSNTPSVFR